MTPEVHLKKSPFPHAIIDNFYNQEELDNIFIEIDFLYPKLKTLGKNLGTAFDYLLGDYISSGKAIALNSFYSCPTHSSIITASDKIFSSSLLFTLSGLHYLYDNVTKLNWSDTLLKYYDDNDSYKSHQDSARYTLLNWFCKDEKAFDGGDLVFKQFDNYKIEFKNNRAVFFNGVIFHESTPIKFKTKNTEQMGKFVVTKFMDIDYGN